MSRRISAATLFFSFLAVLLMMNTSRAQQLDCSVSVKKALQATNDKCAQMTRNKACYGSGLVTALPVDGASNFTFQAPGDIVDINQIKSLRLAALDSKGTQWGVAYMRIQANLPDTAAGQFVTMLMFGDAELQDLSQTVSTGSASTKPIQAVYFQTGVGSPTCHNAPTSGMLIQAPQGAKTVKLTVNGVELGINSTVFIQAQSATLDKLKPIGGAKVATASPTATRKASPTAIPTASPTATRKVPSTAVPTATRKPLPTAPATKKPAANGPKLIITTIQGHVTVTSNGHTKLITNNQSVSVTLNDQGNAPVDNPIVGTPPDNMGALINLTVHDGSDGLFLTTPDLSATEDFTGTIPPDTIGMTDTPEAIPTAGGADGTSTASPETITPDSQSTMIPAEPTNQDTASQPSAIPPTTENSSSQPTAVPPQQSGQGSAGQLTAVPPQQNGQGSGNPPTAVPPDQSSQSSNNQPPANPPDQSSQDSNNPPPP